MKLRRLLILLKIVIEDLFKNTLILFLFLSLALQASDLEYKNYIFSDFVPYQESKTSFGINIFKVSEIKTSFIYHNWFSKNLYFDGSLQSLKKENLININYKVSLAYAYTFKNTYFKNLLINMGYLKSRFDNSINNSSMLYGFLLNFKFKSFWLSSSYNRLKFDNKINQLSLSFIKSFNKTLLVSLNCSFLDGKEGYSVNPYISLRYNI